VIFGPNSSFSAVDNRVFKKWGGIKLNAESRKLEEEGDASRFKVLKLFKAQSG
jgi:hypothetical protein